MNIFDLYRQYSGSRDRFVNEGLKLGNLGTKRQLEDFFDKQSGAGNNTNPFKTDIKGSTEIYKIQDLGSEVSSYQQKGDLIQPSTIIEGVRDVVAGFFAKDANFVTGLKNIGGMAIEAIAKGTTDILTKEVTLRNEINSKIGIAGELSRDLRSEIFDALPGVVSMGYGFEDLKDTVIKTMGETGRFSMMNQETMSNMAKTSRAFVGDLEDMGKIFRNFEMVGIGAQNALETIDKVGKSSLTLGLQSRKVVEQVQTNLAKINEYGFAKGIEGLTRMVQKSIEFRMNMNEVFELAEDVMDPEKAIAMSAELQAIGGAIGDFNDPIKLMYMATNNVEGLQDALIGVAGSLATYNKEQGRFEITGANLRKARALAKELGIQYSELANMATAAAERSSAASALMSSGLNLDEKEKEFLTNVSRMEGGKMVIDVPKSLADQLGLKETRVALEDLGQGTADAILKNQKYFETLTTEQIALEQYTETQKLSLTVSEIATMMKVQFAKTVRTPLEKVDETIKGVNDYMKEAAKGNSPDNKFSAELQRIKNETNKLADDFIKKDLGVKETSTAQKPKVEMTITSDVNQDKLANYIGNNQAFADAIYGKFFVNGDYTNPTMPNK